MARLSAAKVFLEECATEMGKVTWPDKGQIRNATWVVILFTILISAVIWVMDLASRLVIVDFIMGLFRS